MAFVEQRLPEDVERGASGGPGFKTTVITLSSGYERRNQDWEKVRGKWDIGYGLTRKSQIEAVINHFYAMRGQLTGFRFKDWSDFQIGDSLGGDATTRQSIGLTDGTNATFQIFKRYSVAAYFFDREITKPVSGTVRVWVNDIERVEGAGADQFQVDTTTGIITIGSTLAALNGPAVEVICEFDVPVRFESDSLDITTEVFSDEAAISMPRINVQEIRV